MGLVDGQLLVANEHSDGVARLRPDDDRRSVADVLDWPSPTGCAALP
jgi:hypothetical protein